MRTAPHTRSCFLALPRIGRVGRVGLLLKAAQLDGAGSGAGAPGAEAVVVNTLGVLANCAVEPAVAEALVGKLAALPVLLAMMTPQTPTAVASRAVLLLSRLVARHPDPPAVAQLLAGASPGTLEQQASLDTVYELVC